MANDTTVEYVTGVTPDASLPVLAPSAGITGYSQRWIAQGLDGADGAAVTSWSDIVAGRTLVTNQGAGAGVTKKISGPDAYVHFDGTSGSLLESDTLTTSPLSVMALVRVPTGGGLGLYAASNVFSSRGSSGQFNVNCGTGGGGVQVSLTNGVPLDTWLVLGWSQAGAASFVYSNGTKLVGTLGTGAATKFGLGQLQAGALTQMDCAELIAWPTALTQAQMDTVRASLQANYALI